MAMTLRLTPDHDRALTLLAEMTGTSKHEAVIRAIVGTAARTVDNEEIRAYARARIPEYAELATKVRR
ncbi:CopG family transcriptional regulator [Corynebacterium kroppenstedtii]|uniref:CopG family transcriptional regulator n=1 Tax=Corynebacterium sp. PCR 32 TaxID=3351342 RepID=UPI003096E4EE